MRLHIDLDYFLHHGDTNSETTQHHILIFPHGTLGTIKFHSSIPWPSTGYIGTEMWTTILPKYATGIQNAFGINHVLKHQELLTSQYSNTTSGNYSGYTGASSSWAWTDVIVNLFNEPMVYGTISLSSSLYDVGDCDTQISAFKYKKSLIFTRAAHTMLRSIVVSSWSVFWIPFFK